MSNKGALHWRSAARTHKGKIRKINEDSFLEQSDYGIWAVADGMGGHAVGDVASQMVVSTLAEMPYQSNLEALEAEVRRRLQEVNHRLREEAAARQERVIGSTVVVLLGYGQRCIYLWAGDSRVYLFRNGGLRQLSHDHSHVEALISHGLLDRREAQNHPSAGAITRAVGAVDTLELDRGALEVKSGDVFLLCSDGLHNEVSDEDIGGILREENYQKSSEMLVDLALKRGGRDNVTVVVVLAEDQMDGTRTLLNPLIANP
ncbi:Phosphoprotein phosphatase [Nitrosococcus halophilus Nc 4]|uniref:Phosphoprotein phosphatase n=1 Tax=Nitrosococcus halophilus (strain Nc4) TaxID=472759 RepID=D5BXP9_NITHN|nr:protein phosphatase 2C domain-containing protein [Nitrosococcus halophilus]ADE14007.1 Phosphoprotein phosphatase [Nitrosococcus halophilus Nc 4]